MAFSLRKSKLWVQMMIPVVTMLIKLVGIKRTSQLVCNATHFKKIESNDNRHQAMLALGALKKGVQQTRWKGNCLSRSIVLHGMLIRKGISSTLCIGVRKKTIFKAHAWVEHKGKPLNAGPNVHTNYQVVSDFELIKGIEFS